MRKGRIPVLVAFTLLILAWLESRPSRWQIAASPRSTKGLRMTIPLLAMVSLSLQLAAAAVPGSHEFEFVYRTEITPPQDGAPLEVFLPMAVSDEHQEVSKPALKGPLVLEEGHEPKYGNRFLHGTLDGRVQLGQEGPFVI